MVTACLIGAIFILETVKVLLNKKVVVTFLLRDEIIFVFLIWIVPFVL